MEIPYTVTARPDTGLYNAKLGIWLFLASEVMLFGGLFSAYVFTRLGSEAGYWPVGLLNVPVGTMNTAILIASSVTVVLAWAALKMRQYTKYWWYMLFTIVCGTIFLTVKLSYEYPEKFNHFGVYLRQDAAPKYEEFLGNNYLTSHGKDPRWEIAGHLHAAAVTIEGKHFHWHDEKSHGGPALTPMKLTANVENEIKKLKEERLKTDLEARKSQKGSELTAQERQEVQKAVRAWYPKVTYDEYKLAVDEVHTDPTNPKYEKIAFFPRPISHKEVTIKGEDVQSASAFFPRHSTYFSNYFLITGLHGLHVLGGVVVFAYFLITGGKMYRRNPEHLANRVEVAGLFWHFVDLVWIFVFPIFYLL